MNILIRGGSPDSELLFDGADDDPRPRLLGGGISPLPPDLRTSISFVNDVPAYFPLHFDYVQCR